MSRSRSQGISSFNLGAKVAEVPFARCTDRFDGLDHIRVTLTDGGKEAEVDVRGGGYLTAASSEPMKGCEQHFVEFTILKRVHGCCCGVIATPTLLASHPCAHRVSLDDMAVRDTMLRLLSNVSVSTPGEGASDISVLPPPNVRDGGCRVVDPRTNQVLSQVGVGGLDATARTRTGVLCHSCSPQQLPNSSSPAAPQDVLSSSQHLLSSFSAAAAREPRGSAASRRPLHHALRRAEGLGSACCDTSWLSAGFRCREPRRRGLGGDPAHLSAGAAIYVSRV